MIELCEATEDNPFIHGMSKQFVKALQQLFDVMDTEQIGTIKFIDLANQWEEDDGDPFFPKGLISCLAKVQLPNGLLTFDRFCAGIKLCLLKNQVDIKDIRIEETTISNNNTNRINQNNPGANTDRPSSEPQIFAPPPPSSLSSNCHHLNNEVNNNNIYNNKSIPPLSPTTISSFNNSAISSNNDENTLSKSSKKLPLPSYEQVMAAKSKSTSKLVKNEIQIEESMIMPNISSKPVNILPVFNHRPDDQKIVNQYENKFCIKGINKQMIHSCRAKSMPHLDYMSSDHVPIEVQASNDSAIGESPNHKSNNNNNNNNNNTNTTTNNNNSNNNNNNSNSNNNKSIDVKSSTISGNTNSSQPKTVSRNCIMKTLQNWRDNILNKQINDVRHDFYLKDANVMDNVIDGDSFNDIASLTSNSLRRSFVKRREPRRHTVGANGIDLYTVKRFQQLEQEKDILIRGLNEVERTKEWYVRQISSIQDKINFAGRCGTFPSDCNIDAYQERINFQAIRIKTLNQHLMALREAGQSFPIHMNLAIRPLNGILRIDPNQPRQLVINPNLVNKLKEQNRLLTDEVTRKSERITQLEREKSSLIRELFQARTYSSYYNGHFDDTFM